MSKPPEKQHFRNASPAPAVAEEIESWGRTLIVAPHPDDESLGCGGAIALLSLRRMPVAVLAMSDGTLSHPNSQKFPPARLRALRESEMIAALEILGAGRETATFFRFRDRHVPGEDDAGFDAAVERVARFLADFRPETVLAPWRRDPHPDHRACWQIVRSAMRRGNGASVAGRLLEYPIWLWELAAGGDWPVEENIRAVRLDIGAVVARKQAAIRAHASQTTDLIDDDPDGFRLAPEVLAHFNAPYEIFFEERR